MRILYIQDSLGTGGAERSNAELWYFLKEKNIQFKIIILEHRSEGIEREILDNAFNVSFLTRTSFLGQTKEIRGIIKKYKPDLIHSVLLKANLRTRFAQIGFGVIHVESLVNCTYSEIRYRDPKINSSFLKVYEYLDRYTGHFGVDKFIAITQAVKDHYVKKLKINPHKIDLIYRGRKENEVYFDYKRLNSNPRRFNFIHVGRQEFQKGHLSLLKAIKEIDGELYNEGVHFYFCGRRGNASDAIDKFLKESKLKTPIEFLGHRNDIPKLLLKADVFIFPSLYEGLGGALIEAQAAGLPVVCSDIEVFKEVVTNENALFHKVNDPNSIADKMKAIMKKDLKAMGEASYKNYRQKFQLEKINTQMLSEYESLIGQG